jgi:hypothetical protein
MIQTIIIPDDTIVNITIPKHYIGKKMYALFYIDEEIISNVIPPSVQKPSDFFGTLSAEEGAKMHIHAIETRKEWSRDI